MAKKGQKFRKYDLDFKLKVIMEHIDENKSITYLSKEYNVLLSTVRTWVYQYKHGNRFDVQRGRSKGSGNIDYKERYEILKKYQAFLKEQRMRR